MTASAQTTNGYDATKTKSFVDRIESKKAEKVALHSAYMADCRVINEDVNDILEEASEAGLPRKALKKVLKVRELERKAEAARDELDGEDQDNFDLIRHALGDLNGTPLGDAAVEKKAKKGSGLPGADAHGTHSSV